MRRFFILPRCVLRTSRGLRGPRCKTPYVLSVFTAKEAAASGDDEWDDDWEDEEEEKDEDWEEYDEL